MSGETDKQIVQALALRSAAAGASGALASSHGTDWPARVSVRELEESGRYRVTVHGPGDPPPGDLGAAVLHAEGCAARVLAAPSGSSLQRAELGLLESALGGVLRECVVAGERLRLVLERYVREGLNVEESTGERPPELTSAELLSSLLGRWAEEREAVRERGLAALVRPTPGIEVERYLEVLFHDRQADTIAAQETEIERLRGLVTRCAEAGVDPDPTDDAVPGLVAARVDELTRATSGDELRRLLQAVVASRAGQTLEKVAPALHRQILEAIDPGGEGGEDPARPGASRWQDAPPGSVVEVDGFLVVRWPAPDERGCDAAFVTPAMGAFKATRTPLWPYPTSAPGANDAAPVRVVAIGLTAEECAALAAGDVAALAERLEALRHARPSGMDALAAELSARAFESGDPVRAGETWLDAAARIMAEERKALELQREALDAAAQAIGEASRDPVFLRMRLDDLVADVKGRELRAEAETRQWRARWENLCRELGLPAQGVPLEDVFRRVARLRGRGLGIDHAEVRVAGDRDPVKNPRPGDVWRLADESMWRVDQVLGESTTGVIVGASLILVRVGVVDTRRARVDLLALPDLLFGAMLLRAGAAKEA